MNTYLNTLAIFKWNANLHTHNFVFEKSHFNEYTYVWRQYSCHCQQALSTVMWYRIKQFFVCIGISTALNSLIASNITRFIGLCQFSYDKSPTKPAPVAARSKAYVCGSTPVETVGSNPAGSWMFVSCECCVLSGRGLCDELITRSEESYRLCDVVMYDIETT
jgi:hypothetical protein